jgi:hypothetical protein
MRGAFSDRRAVGVQALLLAATLTGVLSILGLWARAQLLNTTAWTRTSSELLEDPAVRTTVATTLVDQLYANVDLAGELRTRLPSDLRPLASPVAGALRDPLQRAVERLLEAPRFQALWSTANRLTHEQLVNIIEDRGRAIRLPGGGAVYLDLRPLAGRIADQLGLSGSRVGQIPRIKVLSSDQVDAAQRGVKLLKALGIALLVLTLLLLCAAVALARPERRRNVIAAAGVRLVIAGLLVLVVRRIAGHVLVDDLANTAAGRDVAGDVWRIATSLLAGVAGVMIVAGLLVALPAAVAVRRRVPAVVRGAPWLVAGAALALALLIVVAVPLRGFDTWPATLILAAAALGGAALLVTAPGAPGPVARP